jgi:hypothetical protein
MMIMKTIGNIIKRSLLVLSVWVMATSCIFDKMDNSEKLQSVFIQVNVNAEEMTKSTPALEAGAESAIKSIRIYAFYNGQLSGHFLRETVSSEPIIMDLLLPYSGTHNVDFYVIANESGIDAAAGSPAISKSTTQEQLKAICMKGVENPSTNGLPMIYNDVVGINVDNIRNTTDELHEDHYWLIQQLDVDLVRPVSKIGVYVAEVEQGSAVYETTSPKLTITDIQISNVIAQGYLFDVNSATAYTSDFSSGTDVQVVNVIGEQNGEAISNSDNYTEVLAPHYFFENGFGGTAWSSGIVESSTDFTQVSQGAVLVKIGYSFDSGATSQHVYVKMPELERNVFYKVMCRFSPVGGHQEILISINEWNYTTHTYEEVIVKSK